ncbi:MAG: tRNA threonylcarbamoyladenosine dehydratase [Eubacteriales bacterium]|jgi:tRNA A37 threonylcarbamoyladenosine dehydratase
MEIPSSMSRTAMLIGAGAVKALMSARVAVFGLGGVGGSLCEALARAGVGNLTLIDKDTVAPSNINRQIVALHSTLGRPKTEVMRERILDINPSCRVTLYSMFYDATTADRLDFSEYDYIADAIDTVTSKLLIAVRAKEAGVPLISAMGTGNKLDPTRLEITDISKTDTCPLARVMRRELRARGIEHLEVVFSREPARTPDAGFCVDGSASRRLPPGTLPLVPNAAGILMASRIIRHIIENPEKREMAGN